MAEVTTLARPYAQALFSLAKETQTLDEWSSTLGFFGRVVQDETFKSVVNAPDVKLSDIERLLLSICSDQFSR